MSNPHHLNLFTPNAEQLQRRCDEFNEQNPVGTRVMRFSMISPPRGPLGETTTRSKAFVMSGHSAMVMLTGVSGGWSLDGIQIVGPEGSLP